MTDARSTVCINVFRVTWGTLQPRLKHIFTVVVSNPWLSVKPFWQVAKVVMLRMSVTITSWTVHDNLLCRLELTAGPE